MVDLIGGDTIIVNSESTTTLYHLTISIDDENDNGKYMK